MDKEKIEEALYFLAMEIRELKEAQCGNSGYNWFEEFKRQFLED